MQVADESASRLEGGPLARVQAARWMSFSQQPDTMVRAVRHLNRLSRQFALGDAQGLAGGAHLFAQVSPWGWVDGVPHCCR